MEESTDRYQRRFWAQTPAMILSSSSAGRGDAAADAPLFDFKSVVRLLRRRTALILGVMLVCVAIMVFIDSLTPRLFSATTRVLLDEQAVNPFGREEVFTEIDLSNAAVESQMQVIRSPYLLSQVVDQLNLGENEEFMARPTTPMRERLLEVKSSIFPSGDQPIDERTEAERFQAAVERLRSGLRVSRDARTLVLQLEFTSASPRLAADVVNAVTEIYIGNRLGIRQDSAAQASEWFDERMSELNAQALDVEQRMERLSRGGGEALEASEMADAMQRARMDLQSSMAASARARADLQRLRAIVESGRGLRGVPESLATGAINTLVEEASATRSELAEALLQDPGDAAAIEMLTARIEALEEAGASLLESMLQEAQALADTTLSVENAAQEAFEAARGAGGGSITNAIEVELRSLEGEARIYRQLHESYLESYLRTVQQQSFPSTEATVIETAIVPEYPDGAGLSRLIVLAVFVGLTLGAGGAFAIEAADDRVRTSNQLARAAGAPFLGVLPTEVDERRAAASPSGRLNLPLIHVPARRRDIEHQVIALPENRVSLTHEVPQLYAAITNPLSLFSETIRRVNVEADQIQALVADGKKLPTKIIGFLSDQPSRGRSVAAVNYAEMLAVGGSQTLLIDLDWTGIFLSEKIAPVAQFGIAELVMADTAIRSEQAFWYDERTSLCFLPNRSMAQDATLDPGAFDHARLKQLIMTLAKKFDSIVIDLSPLATSSDPAAMSEIVSGFVAVADWGQTRSSSLSAELHRAAIYPPKLLGTVLNGVSSKELGKYQAAA